MNMKSNLGFLRILALFEGVTLLLFPITMYLNSANEMPMPNRVLGMLHGGLFIVYSLWLFIVAKQKKWSLKTIGLSFFASFIPFGTFYSRSLYFQKGTTLVFNTDAFV